MSERPTPPPVLPAGTQVVLREALTDLTGVLAQRGATGRVIGIATEDGPVYLVRLGDGRELHALRGALTLRRAHQSNIAITAELAEFDGAALVRQRTILATVVGSRAFGLAGDDSDVDTRGVYLAPTSAFWSFAKPPMHVDGPEPEWFSWEVERFCELALKANPNLLEVLHSPLVVSCTPVGEELRALAPAFLSQLAYQTYSGYVLSQFKKIEADLRGNGSPRWKHVMHLLRLLLSARDLIAEGEFRIDVGPHRERLLAVRHGELTWDQVEAWRLALHREVDDALPRSPLPAAPATVQVDAWLRSVRARDLTAAP